MVLLPFFLGDEDSETLKKLELDKETYGWPGILPLTSQLCVVYGKSSRTK